MVVSEACSPRTGTRQADRDGRTHGRKLGNALWKIDGDCSATCLQASDENRDRSTAAITR